ncbi:hypothetical protein GWK47_013371 [Chionoecetes opilio]|uniref:Uncharacterized protein n=1 Tax=Chionoecetes opilio TaxID=41210 RepID=A0A8J4Y0Q2_CHIOP|nr:hypothetical protein GWK47_013371 [Chionoecetes opilio]
MAGRLPGDSVSSSPPSTVMVALRLLRRFGSRLPRLHVCSPVFTEEGELEEMAHFTFMCGQRAVFSQDSLTCAHPTEALPCSEATAHYDESNAEFGIIPEEHPGIHEQALQ